MAQEVDDKSYDLRTRKALVAHKGPIAQTLEKGKTYFWCTCGYSKNQPWCDGSHMKINSEEGLDFQPLVFEYKQETAEQWLCQCKQTKNAPFCDGSHTKVSEDSFDIKTKALVAGKTPIAVKVEKGKTYYWCVCGWSKNQPFCDGSHLEANDTTGSDFMPIPWTAEVDGEEKWFCRCKQTKNPPFCDGSHLALVSDAAATDESSPTSANTVKVTRRRNSFKQTSAVPPEVLVARCWRRLLAEHPMEEFGHLFYSNLFKVEGTNFEATIFKGVDMKKQADLLIAMFSTIVLTVDDLPSLRPKLLELGARHVDYHVEPEHFDAMGVALFATLQEVLQESNADSEIMQAWRTIFVDVLREVILEGIQNRLKKEKKQQSAEEESRGGRVAATTGGEFLNDPGCWNIKTRARVAAKSSIGVQVEAGKTYYWCTCGYSKNQPWCDGSHVAKNAEFGFNFQPLAWTANESGTKNFCQCKRTEHPPLCDGTHRSLPDESVGVDNPAEKKKTESPTTTDTADPDSFNIKTRARVAAKISIAGEVVEGKTYYWCTCGYSKNQPWCDGSHVAKNAELGTEFQPMAWTAKESSTKFFCQCKRTSNPPFCDGTHRSISDEEAGIEKKPDDDQKKTKEEKSSPTSQKERDIGAPEAVASGSYSIKTKGLLPQESDPSNRKRPIGVDVKAGQTYYWCSCGLSRNQPWCDGSHVAHNAENGTRFMPLAWTATADDTKYFCACKQTDHPPFCDGAHSSL